MEITLFQGLMLTVVGFICGLDQCWEAFFWFRPMVVSFLAGIVLGDVQLGVACGAVAELSYLGLLSVGGTVPPDPLMAGMMTVVIAYTTGQSAETAIGLSLPFALLAQWMGIFFNTVYVGIAHRCDKLAAEGDANGFKRIVYAGILIKTSAIALLVFLCTYALQAPIQSFVNTFPEELIHGFEIAGGLLPAIGLGLLLMVTLKKENAPYLFLGFIMATFLVMPNVMPIAIVGVCLAFINYMYEKKIDNASATVTVNDIGGEENGI
ncbi:PTS system galactosamine-specific IIC component [Breznakia sp. PF5-3]|uniref:PTS mannose/fructose/sorbose/N-acetylgalactosamine transporter subunit IIC n=1 Tax=unclassified Breznakia TaxID=2623764 RepID=UPI00240609FC|nr:MULTISPECIES: PTS sugar transporter subunit IIC [unclassified Breznakia]MDF9824762.1 PTS system galactosamine-specific IIC component [Breznakia sp. PM6-1]MDF9835671.1 PTS system galactosamine-specific IIC component [Breznakia sp. PF5-3]MDF9837720.1 PTS system galactosamine-specific IIC component [Breznakia sp. PFB2-8]MDF9859681.1 PTS system galactosamine-specific IIC component [Breznakia sp. PH5-24]